MSIEVDRTRGLEREGILSDRVRWNLPTAALFEEAVRRQEGVIAANGPLACRTGRHTGRSPNDKLVVREPSSEAVIALVPGGRDAAALRDGCRCTVAPVILLV